MIDFPFGVKASHLIWDELTGYPALHRDARELLKWLCYLVASHRWAKPTITCFGRTRANQAQIYPSSPNKFSWHCLASHDGKARAFDVRTQTSVGDKVVRVYSKEQLDQIVAAAKVEFPGCEALYHVGTAPHLHLAVPAAERPKDWV